MIVTTGAALAATVTVTPIWAVPGSPRLSVAVAVTIWLPTDSDAVEKPAPLPIDPSRSELQARPAVRSPSSASDAPPLKLTVWPATKLDPSAGAVMVTTGA